MAVAVCAAVLRGLAVPGRLAAANLAASARRLSPAVSALVLAVSLGGSLWFLQTSIRHVTLQQSRVGLLADQVIVTTGASLPAGVAQAARLDSLVLVADRRGAGHANVRAALTRAIQGLDPAAQVATPDGYQAAVNAQVARTPGLSMSS